MKRNSSARVKEDDYSGNAEPTRFGRFSRYEKPEKFDWKDWNARLLILCIAFIALFGILITIRLKTPDIRALLITLGCTATIYFAARFIPEFGVADQLASTLVTFLGSFGALYQYSLSQTASGINQTIFYAIGLLVFVVASYLTRYWVFTPRFSDKARLALFAASALFLVVAFFDDSRQWIRLFGMSVQPSEFVKVSFILLLANILKDRKLKYPMVSALIMGFALMGLVVLQGDFGTTLVYYGVLLAIVYVAAPRLWTLLVEAAVSAVLFLVVYYMNDGVQTRFSLFNTQFSALVADKTQMSLSLMSLANGGATGTGLGLGRSGSIPVHSTDFIFPVVCEEFGFVFGLALLFALFVLIWKFMGTASRASTRYSAMLATGCAVAIGFQAFIIVGGSTNMIPLTGVNLPFISGGGSSLLSVMALCGIAEGVSAAGEAQRRPKPARAKSSYSIGSRTEEF